MSATLIGSEVPLQEAYDVALVDLDGVCYKGPHAIETAPVGLAGARHAGMGLIFVTNNASREPEDVAAHLTELGISAQPHEVLTSAQAGAELLASRVAAGSRVLVVGGAGLKTAVADRGLEIVESAADRPAAVIQGFAPHVGWEHLAQAAYAIQAGALFVATNLDLTLPNEHGLAPGNGSLVAVVRAATGVEPASAGKPAPAMFHLAASRAGAARPLVIGDRLDTDLAGARAAGMDGLLVLTGVHGIRAAMAAPPQHRPSFIVNDLRELATSQPAPIRHDNGWQVGSARARVHDGAVHVEPADAGDGWLDGARAACVAAWDAADAGLDLDVSQIQGLQVAS